MTKKEKLIESAVRKIYKKVVNEQKLNELNLIHSKHFDAFEKDCIALAKKYWGPGGCKREDFVGSAYRYLPNDLV